MVMQSSTFTDATRPTVPGNDLALFIGELRETTQEQGNMVSLVTVDDLPQKMGTTYNTPKLGAFTAGALTEGMDVATFQQLTMSNVVVTPGEVGLAFKFSKRSLAQWNDPMQVRAGGVAKQAVQRKRDSDIIGLSPSFTTFTALGSNSTVMTLGHIVAGVASLKAGSSNNVASTALAAGAVSNQAPPGDINCVQRWESLTKVMKLLIGGAVGVAGTALAQTNLPPADGGIGAQAAESLWVGKAGGAQIYGNSNIAVNASNGQNGLIFHKASMLYVNFTHDGAGDIFQRDSNDGRSIQLTLVDDYGFGVLDQNYAIETTFDATLPTS